VVEHDMQFIRMIARKVTVFNQGPCSSRTTSAKSCQSAGARRLSRQAGGGMMLNVSRPRHRLWPHPDPHRNRLTVAGGEFVGILGHNGMGKTTLLKALMGFCPHQRHVHARRADVTARHRIGAPALGHRLRAAGPRDFPRL
jgi:ABC-type glutathione transport system ATPase component